MSKIESLNTGLILFVAVAGVAGYLDLRQNLRARSEELSQITGQMSQQTAVIDRGLEEVNLQVSQQTAIIHRALGKVLPIELPAEIEDQITEIKGLLADRNRWPARLEDVEEVRAKLAATVDRMPPWAQEELLPQLVPLRWDLDALWLLRQKRHEGPDDLSRQASLIGYLLDNKPLSGSEAMSQQLMALEQELTRAVTAIERDDAIKKGQQALKDRSGINEAVRVLEEYPDKDAAALRQQLADLLLVQLLKDSVDFMSKELDRTLVLEDPALKSAALARLGEMVVDIRLRVSAAQADRPAMKNQLTAVDREAQSMESKVRDEFRRSQTTALRDYQVWALTQIQKVERLKDIEKVELARIPSTIDRNNPASDAYSQAKARSLTILEIKMRHHLAPIDQGLLDIAVGQLFRTVYQHGLSDLSADESKQRSIIETFANTPKRGLESLP